MKLDWEVYTYGCGEVVLLGFGEGFVSYCIARLEEGYTIKGNEEDSNDQG